MITPYIILVLGYTLLASLFLWISISIKGRWVAKAVVIPFVMWFGLFLYYVPPQLTGYPSTQEITKERVIVRYFQAQRPTKVSEGAIYVVVDSRFFEDLKEETLIDKINPMTYTDASELSHLRFYRLPWDKELVDNLQKAKKNKQLAILKKNGKNGKGDGEEGQKGKKGKKGKKKGEGKENGEPGDGEDGKGGTGGTAKESKSDSKYSVEALTPNEVFKKAD